MGSLPACFEGLLHRSQPFWIGAAVCCRDRAGFQQWADVLASWFGYDVTFTGVGKAINGNEALLKLGMVGKDLGHASQVTGGYAGSYNLASSGQSTFVTLLGPADTCESSSGMSSDSMATPRNLQQNICCKE